MMPEHGIPPVCSYTIIPRSIRTPRSNHPITSSLRRNLKPPFATSINYPRRLSVSLPTWRQVQAVLVLWRFTRKYPAGCPNRQERRLYAHSSSIKTAPQVPNPPSATSFQAPRSISKRPPVRPVVSLAPPSNDRSPSRSEALVDAAGREDSPKIRNPRCQGDRRDTGGLWQAETTHGREQSLPTVDRQPPSDENSEARQNAGATLHLDGAALGRWTIQHIERALARPSNGMTGVDPRATMPRGHISPF